MNSEVKLTEMCFERAMYILHVKRTYRQYTVCRFVYIFVAYVSVILFIYATQIIRTYRLHTAIEIYTLILQLQIS